MGTKLDKFLAEYGVTKEELTTVNNLLVNLYKGFSSLRDYLEQDKYINVLNGETNTQELYTKAFKYSFDEEQAVLFEQINVLSEILSDGRPLTERNDVSFEGTLRQIKGTLSEIRKLTEESRVQVDYLVHHLDQVVKDYGEEESQDHSIFNIGISVFQQRFDEFADAFVKDVS